MKQYRKLFSLVLAAMLIAGCQKPVRNTETESASVTESVETQALATTPETVAESAAETVEESSETPTEPEKPADPITEHINKDNFPVIDGSTATIPLSEALYCYLTGGTEEEAHSVIHHTKTNKSFTSLFEGNADILIVYEPSESVYAQIESTYPVKMKPIGKDALVFMANTDNPVNSLTSEQLVGIYSGQYTNWNQVGGNDLKINAFQRPEGSGSQNLMQKLLMKDVPMMEGENIYRYSTMSGILEGMLSYNGENSTLGYSVFYYANNMYYLPELKFMAVDGVLPSTETIYDGSYYLANSFYAVILDSTPQDSPAYELYEWLTTENAQGMIMDLGYVPEIMPQGHTFGGEQTYQKAGAEVVHPIPLAEDEYFVFYNEITGEYGNVIIYDHTWEPIMTFYNVAIPYEFMGVIQRETICIGQIRMTPEGSYKMGYGIFDLKTRSYTVLPENLRIIPVPHNTDHYLCYPPESWDVGKVIDQNGAVCITGVKERDFLPVVTCLDGQYWVLGRNTEDWEDEVLIYDADYQLAEIRKGTPENYPMEWTEGSYYADREPEVVAEYADGATSFRYNDELLLQCPGEYNYSGCYGEHGDYYLAYAGLIETDGDKDLFDEEYNPCISVFDIVVFNQGKLIYQSKVPSSFTTIDEGRLFVLEDGNRVRVLDDSGNVVLTALSARMNRD